MSQDNLEGPHREKSFLALIHDEAVEAVTRRLAEDPGLAGLRDDEGQTPLHGCRHLGIVRALLDSGANLEARDQSGFTPLHCVQISGSAEVSEELLLRGADVATIDIDGNTALHAAATFLGVDSVVMLLEHGADESATNKRGYTALHEALDDGSLQTASFLWQRSSCRDACVAAGLDDVDQLRALLSESPECRASIDGRGRTPLHWAVRCGAVEATRVLVDGGAPLEARDEGGRTPLHWTAFSLPLLEALGPNTTALDIARVLVEAGASVQALNDAAKRPADLVDWRRKPALCAWLRELTSS